MGKTLVIGSTCVDVIIQLEHLPKTEEDMHPRAQRFAVGGCACNVAGILGRGGADTLFVTPVGLRGLFGPFVLRTLEKQPWARPVLLPEEENGCCYCLVEDGGERTFLSCHGVEYTFRSEWMAPWAEEHFDCAYVCGLEVEEATGDALVDWLEAASPRIGRVFYAPGPRGARVPRERTDRLLALQPILHLNEAEALALSGEGDLAAAAGALFARTGAPVIVTLGDQGACCRTEEGLRWYPPSPVARVEDTIGAGDAHAGALLLAMSRGKPLDAALAFANRVAARVVQVSGASLPEGDRVLED